MDDDKPDGEEEDVLHRAGDRPDNEESHESCSNEVSQYFVVAGAQDEEEEEGLEVDVVDGMLPLHGF